MAKIDDPNRIFKSNPPTYSNGSTFLGYRVPAAQTFTSFSPSSDINAYMQAITGLSGYKQRNLLQSSIGTQVLNQSANGETSNSTSFLGFPGFHSKASCQTDSDCGDNQICYAFNEQVFGPQQGPTCTPAAYPEIILGNAFNDGKPLRQDSNYCYTDQDCQGIDKLTGKKKQGMTCNHFYKGPNIFEKNGVCQVQYEANGRRNFLKTPPGWTWPMNQKLKKCNTQSDCGVTGINGWTRCVAGADDGNKYCVWPGQTGTPTPKQLEGQVPAGFTSQPPPSFPTPTGIQSKMLNLESSSANMPQFQTPGGDLRNVSGPPTPANELVSGNGTPANWMQ